MTTSRREARERAIELLYEAEAKSVHPTAVIAELTLPPDDYAAELACGVADHAEELDQLLGRYAKKWDPSRMAVMDRTVMRVGAFELALQPDVPTAAALNEAVDLGTQYGSTDDTGRFVNGVLASVAEEVRDGARPWTPIDAVVFDMDGVIRHWTDDRIRRLEDQTGVEGLRVAEIAFTPDLYEPAMSGGMTMGEWAAEIGRRVADTHEGVDAAVVEAAWLESSWRIDEAVVDIVRATRAAGVKVGMFSNASSQLEDDLATIGIADLFDPVANSSRLGDVKPNVNAFRQVAGMVGAEPHRMLFVDDRPENVIGAVKAGWHAVRMIDADRLRATLVRFGILDA